MQREATAQDCSKNRRTYSPSTNSVTDITSCLQRLQRIHEGEAKALHMRCGVSYEDVQAAIQSELERLESIYEVNLANADILRAERMQKHRNDQAYVKRLIDDASRVATSEQLYRATVLERRLFGEIEDYKIVETKSKSLMVYLKMKNLAVKYRYPLKELFKLGVQEWMKILELARVKLENKEKFAGAVVSTLEDLIEGFRDFEGVSPNDQLDAIEKMFMLADRRKHLPYREDGLMNYQIPESAPTPVNQQVVEFPDFGIVIKDLQGNLKFIRARDLQNAPNNLIKSILSVVVSKVTSTIFRVTLIQAIRRQIDNVNAIRHRLHIIQWSELKKKYGVPPETPQQPAQAVQQRTG